MSTINPLLLILLFLIALNVEAKHKRRQIVNFPPTTANQTRSLSGTYATDGNPLINIEAYNLMTLLVLKGFAVFRVKGYNDRVYLEKFRRSYWFGNRYYYMDNEYYLATRDTCSYTMTPEERKDLYYEDGSPIFEIIYQCQRYSQYCCGLDCCRNWDLTHTPPPHRDMKYPWSSPSSSSFISPLLPFCLISSLLLL